MCWQWHRQGVSDICVSVQVLVITVQVASEAADACLRTIVQACHHSKLLQAICHAVTTDKNAKLRQHCSVYLLQVWRLA